MELVKSLAKQLGVTCEQAEGAAGAIFCVVQHRLTADEFVQVAYATPAVSDLMSKAPRFNAASRGGLPGWIGRRFGGLGSLRPLAAVFNELGLVASDIRPVVEVIIEFVRQQGRNDVESLLQKALK